MCISEIDRSRTSLFSEGKRHTDTRGLDHADKCNRRRSSWKRSQTLWLLPEHGYVDEIEVGAR